jgi:glutamate-5-semialdehyde dehydrogenase
MKDFLEKAKQATSIIANLSPSKKSDILHQMAQKLRDNSSIIIEENSKDLNYAKQNNLSIALVDRLLLDTKRVEAMAMALDEIASLKDPVGRVLDGWIQDDGLKIEKVSVPIGVIGIIYESRPNVTSDTAGLSFKSGNVCILKGGKEAINSNQIIAKLLQEVLVDNALPKEAISLLEDSTREGVAKMIKEDRYIDLIIPRGGEALIRFVNDNATIPVVKHDKGLCHTYIDKDANLDMAVSVSINAKCDRPGVCNAMETLLIDKAIAKEFLPTIKQEFDRYHTELLGDDLTNSIIDIKIAKEQDYNTEHLANKLSIKIVDGVDGAIEHIAKYGSGHSEAIITQNYTTSEKFLNYVDASSVYLNASTRFTDGGAFGFGAEVGISTNKLHARGPMGVNDLTTYKYKIYGEGQTR